jgi:hypothetical protein
MRGTFLPDLEIDLIEVWQQKLINESGAGLGAAILF